MGNRRGNRKIRKFRYTIIVILLFSLMFAQAEFQIRTIPSNAYKLSNHNGCSATNDLENSHKKYHFDLIQFPADITYQKIKYKNTSVAILNYGKLVDQIDDQIIKEFDAFEVDIQYSLYKKFRNKFLIFGSSGVTYSQIDNVNSLGIVSNLKFLTSIKKYNLNLSLSINNFGLIINSYTNRSNYFPQQYQLGVLYIIPKTSIQLAYDVVYHFNTKIYEKIYCVNFPIGEIIGLRFSSNNLRKDMLINNYERDWFYGFGYGLSINTKKTIFDVGVSNLGPSGFIYGISISIKNN